jgi:hypothetical protein
VAVLSPPKSTSSYGQEVLAEAKIKFADIIYLEDNEGESIEADISSRHFHNEYHFNACMYPLLASMLPEGLTLVNSEHHKWLEVEGGTSKNDQKPDFWVSPISQLVAVKNLPKTHAVDGCTYGCPLDNCAFTVDCILDGKMGDGALSMEDCGKLFWYLHSLSTSRNANPRGAFYNSSEYVFAEFKGGRLHSIARCLWRTAGSLTSLAKKLRLTDANGTVCALKHFLAAPGTRCISGVLGRGRFGCVFDVMVGGQRFALKVVPSDAENPASTAEYNRMADMHRSHPDLVAAVAEGSLVESETFIYYCLTDVGRGGNHKIRARAAAVMLAKLHSRGVIHGDPRIQNIIELQSNELKWIDFRVPIGTVSRDTRLLFESIFGVNVLDGDDISASAQNYINTAREPHSTFEQLRELIENVYSMCPR